MKDPAFLFYSNDFYEGTRTLLPQERACYIDLMIYQHQHDFIPNDMERISLYCSGISEATLIATLQAKFKLTDKGWVNERLNDVINERITFKSIQSINGTVGQFWKKAKALLNNTMYSQLKDYLFSKSNYEIFDLIKNKKINKAMLEAMLKHIEDVNENENEIENIIEIKNEKKIKNKNFDFDFLNFQPDFLPLVLSWIKYKNETLHQNLTQQQIESFFTQLLGFSENDVAIAQKIINQSISAGHKIIYDLNKPPPGKNATSNKSNLQIFDSVHKIINSKLNLA